MSAFPQPPLPHSLANVSICPTPPPSCRGSFVRIFNTNLSLTDLQKVPKFPRMGIFGRRNFRKKARKFKLPLTPLWCKFWEKKFHKVKKVDKIINYAEIPFFSFSFFTARFPQIHEFPKKNSEICGNKHELLYFVMFMFKNFRTVSKFPWMAFAPFATFAGLLPEWPYLFEESRIFDQVFQHIKRSLITTYIFYLSF